MTDISSVAWLRVWSFLTPSSDFRYATVEACCVSSQTSDRERAPGGPRVTDDLTMSGSYGEHRACVVVCMQWCVHAGGCRLQTPAYFLCRCAWAMFERVCVRVYVYAEGVC